MIVSLGDISLAVRRAVWGSGVPFGVADDAGRAAAALARSGIDPLAAVLDGIEALDLGRSAAVDVEPADQGWRLKPRISDAMISAIYAAPSACDLLVAGCGDNVEVLCVDEPIILAAAAALASEAHGKDLWVASGGDTDAWRFGCEAGVAHLLEGSLDSALSSQSVNVGIAPGSGTRQPPPTPPKDITVNTENWLRIYELGKRSLVPATATSRARGAGAGLVDTD